MTSNSRKPVSNARRNGRSGWSHPNTSGSRHNRRDEVEDDRPQQPNKEQTWVSLISDDEEDEKDVMSPSQKRNVSHVDTPNTSPAPKRVASGPVAGNNRNPIPTAGPAFPTTGLALRLSPSTPQARNTVNQLAAQLHQKQDENAQLAEKIDELRLMSAKKDAEIASLRAVIEGMQQEAAINSPNGTAYPLQQNINGNPPPQQFNGQQSSADGLLLPCTTCAETIDLKQKLADVQLALSRARNTIADQHDEIKALMEQANSSNTALLQERAAVAQHKLSIDRLALKVAAEQATAKDLQTTLAENQVVIDHLNAQLSSQIQELSDARATITTNESTISNLEDQVATKELALEGAFLDKEDTKKTIHELNKPVEDLKNQVANGKATLHDARTTIFVNGTVIQDLKEQVAGGQGAVSENITKDKDKHSDGENENLEGVEELNFKLKEAEQEIEKLAARTNQSEKECEELRNSYHEDQKDKEDLRKSLRSAWEKEDKISAGAELLRQEVEKHQQEVEKHQQELAEYKTKFEGQREKVTECEAKLEQQRQTFDLEKKGMETSIKSLHEQLAHLQSETAPKIEGLRKTLQDLNEQLARIQHERDLAVQEMEKHIANEDRQASQLQAIKSALEISQSHVQSLKNQLDIRSVKFADVEEQLKDIQAQLAAAENRAKEAEIKTAQITNQFESYKEEAAYLKQQEANHYSETIHRLNVTISQLQERNQTLEAVDQSHIIKTVEARIADLQARLGSVQGPVNQAAIEAQIAHIQSQLLQKSDEINSANAQLERVFNQYQELSDKRAEDKKRFAALAQQNQVLAEHLEHLVMERDQAQQEAADVKIALIKAETDIQSSELQPNQLVGRRLQGMLTERDKEFQELADTKDALKRAEADVQFLMVQATAIDEGGHPEFAYMESAWEPKLREAKAQLEAVTRERNVALQQLQDLTTQLQTVSREKDEIYQELEVCRGGLAEFQTTVEDLHNQLSRAGSGANPAVLEMLEKARGIQSASDISRNRVHGVSSMKPTAIDLEDQFPIPARSESLPDSGFKSMKKEALQKMMRDLEDRHDKLEDTARRLTTRLKGQTIKTMALEKEMKVLKAIARTKDKLIYQAAARLSGTSYGTSGVANPKDETMMDIDFDSDFNHSDGEDELGKHDVDVKDTGLPRKTLLVTFGPTRRGYKAWKGINACDFDSFDANISQALKVAFLTENGKKIYFTLRQYGNVSRDPGAHRSSPTPTATTATGTQSKDIQGDEAYSLSTASQGTPTSVRPSGPPLRSASSGPSAPQTSLGPPVEFGAAHRRGAAVRTSSPSDPPNTQESSQFLTSAVYPAQSSGSSRGRGTRGKYTSNRFRPSATPTLAGPSQPRRRSVPTSTPQSWSADDAQEQLDVGVDVLGSGFTMESIEQEPEPESPRDKVKGKEKMTPKPQEEYEG